MAKFKTSTPYDSVKYCPCCKQRLPRVHKPIEERFWDKVDKRSPDECWNWKASLSALGYGNFQFNGRVQNAYRASWIINRGPIPKGLCVCHTCDNPACVNPNHLFLGTHLENMRDMASKGRRKTTPQPGAKHWNARLTDNDVHAIRADKESSAKELADKFGVSTSMIYLIVHRKAWRHI